MTLLMVFRVFSLSLRKESVSPSFPPLSLSLFSPPFFPFANQMKLLMVFRVCSLGLAKDVSFSLFFPRFQFFFFRIQEKSLMTFKKLKAKTKEIVRIDYFEHVCDVCDMTHICVYTRHIYVGHASK